MGSLTLAESRALAIRRAIRGLCDGQIRERNGKLRSPLAVEAWEAWGRRNRKRFGESYPALLDAALAMAPTVLLPPLADIVDPALGYEAGVPAYWPGNASPMPLGAVRAATGTKYWEPSETGRWLATLPVYEAAEPGLWWYADRVAWNMAVPKDKAIRDRWLTDWAYVDVVEPELIVEDREDCPLESVRERTQEVLDLWCTTTVACSQRWLDVVDIVTWDPADPAKWWLREGAVDILGSDYVEERLDARKAVRVFATPAGWNDAGAGTADGCAVVDWKGGLPRRMLLEAVGLIGDSTEHGEVLRKLALRAVPQIFVAKGKAAPC